MVVDPHMLERVPSSAMFSQQLASASMQQQPFAPYDAYGRNSMCCQGAWFSFDKAYLDNVSGRLTCSLNMSACLGDVKHGEKRVVKDKPPRSPSSFPSKPTPRLQEACCLSSERALYDKVIQMTPACVDCLLARSSRMTLAHVLIMYRVAILSQSQKVTPIALSQHNPLS